MHVQIDGQLPSIAGPARSSACAADTNLFDNPFTHFDARSSQNFLHHGECGEVFGSDLSLLPQATPTLHHTGVADAPEISPGASLESLYEFDQHLPVTPGSANLPGTLKSSPYPPLDFSSAGFDNALLSFEYGILSGVPQHDNGTADSGPGYTPSTTSSRALADHTAGARDDSQQILFVDNNDKITAARYRNTLTARKNQNKKKSRMDQLEARIRVLEQEKQQWKEKAVHWKNIAEQKLLDTAAATMTEQESLTLT